MWQHQQLKDSLGSPASQMLKNLHTHKTHTLIWSAPLTNDISTKHYHIQVENTFLINAAITTWQSNNKHFLYCLFCHTWIIYILHNSLPSMDNWIRAVPRRPVLTNRHCMSSLFTCTLLLEGSTRLNPGADCIMSCCLFKLHNEYTTKLLPVTT